MSLELITILALVLVFLVATVLPVYMGALAFVAAFVVGTAVVGESTDDIVGGFPGDLFVILVGVTSSSPSPRATARWTGWCRSRSGRSVDGSP